ncbi:MAG TPA: hypothetical protein VHO25_08870 [Polyangiaceae bacterium]|nr:hypothetical protein [Polyangiaceae bacterium]
MPRASKWGSLGIVACGVLGTACMSVDAKVADPSDLRCHDLIAEYQEISKTPEYAEVYPIQRSNYEVRVAECHLEQGDSKTALNLALGAQATVGRDMVLARAQAALDDVEGCHSTLKAVIGAGVRSQYFIDSPEFSRVARFDWFLPLALLAWQREGAPDPEYYVEAVLRRGRHRPLPLRVAAADTARAPGEWVMWNGIIRDVRILHEQSVTMIVAEGVDIKTFQVMRDRRVEKVTHGWASSRPTYSVEDRFEEEFIPMGKEFLVRVGRVDETLASMTHIFVLGKYAGREGEWPVVTPISILERAPKATTVTTKNQR